MDRSLPRQLAVLARITGEDERVNANRRLMATLTRWRSEVNLNSQFPFSSGRRQLNVWV